MSRPDVCKPAHDGEGDFTDPNLNASGETREHRTSFEEQKRRSRSAGRRVARSRMKVEGVEGLSKLLTASCSAKGHTLEECRRALHRGRLTAKEQECRDVLCWAAAVGYWLGATYEMLAEALELGAKARAQVLVGRGREIVIEEERERIDRDWQAKHAGCKRHPRKAFEDCPACERILEQRGPDLTERSSFAPDDEYYENEWAQEEALDSLVGFEDDPY
jgi:hypothetical protein